ncbi:hypothetical protein FDZ73_18765 [bacterium]|nr:MAG: hypothetical protein FDZ73_18765 [bacterium]
MLGFDDEFLEELKEPPPQQEKEVYTTVASEEHYKQLMTQTNQEVQEHNAQVEQRKKRFYLQSEIPVKPCTEECQNRERCKDYLNGRVKDRDLCRPELRQIRKWQVAFRKNDLDSLKDDAGAVAGSMFILAFRLMEKVLEDGVVVDSVKYTNSGIKYYEKMEHPALKRIESICKSLGIDMNNYLMTPKSQKDSPPQVQVNIGISADEVQARFAARFAPKEADVV